MKRFILALFAYLLFIGPALADLNQEKVGQWDLQIDSSTFAMTSDSSWTSTFPGGALTLKGDSGNINICIEDATILGKGRFIFEIECRVTMPDNSAIFLEYNVKITADETWQDRIGKGEVVTAPSGGAKHFFAEFKMKTTSEKYDWVNDHIFIGKGLELRVSSEQRPLGRVLYDLYVFAN